MCMIRRVTDDHLIHARSSSSVMRGQWFALLSRGGWLHQSQHLLQTDDTPDKCNWKLCFTWSLIGYFIDLGMVNQNAITDLYLFGRELFCAAEDVALGDTFAAQLMDLNHAAEGDETHQGVGRQETQRHLKGFFQGLEVFLLQTCVHHIQEDERGWRSTLKRNKSGYIMVIQILHTVFNSFIYSNTF